MISFIFFYIYDKFFLISFARVGLRGHYHCTVLASRLMVENRQVNNKKQNLNNINDKKP